MYEIGRERPGRKAMTGKVSSKELGLILGARLLKTEDLHYGLWSDGLEVTVANMPQAQDNYSAFLMERIPGHVKTILDVGCGTGHLAQLLTERGYRVECISPSPELARHARERLGEAFPIHLTTYEAFQTGNRFDLILFSESFQYIPFRESLPKSHALLSEGGAVLIADFFRIEADTPSALRGGHDLKRFMAYLETQPFAIVSDEDITSLTAPNLDLVEQLITEYVQPIWDTMGYYLRGNRPWLARIGGWLFRKKLEKLHFKYFSRQRNAETFAKHKSYRCLLLKKKEGTGGMAGS